MFFARNPKRSVDTVSEELPELGEQVMMRVVLAFPPRDSVRILERVRRVKSEE